MAWKFRRRVKVFPGVTLNLSRQGVSTTVGPRGLNVNFNRNGTYLNTGLPGTGIYDRHKIGGNRAKRLAPELPNVAPSIDLKGIEPYQTADVEAATTPGLSELYETLRACHQERLDLATEIESGEKAARNSQTLYLVSCIFLIGFALPWFRNRRDQIRRDLAAAREALHTSTIEVALDEDREVATAFQALADSYHQLLGAEKFWDIAATVQVDGRTQRTTASKGYVRAPISFTFGNLPFISCASEGLHFQNAHGSDLYFYPGFLVVLAPSGKFGIVDLREVEVGFEKARFHEVDEVPADALIVDHAWHKANKDGSRDRRFNDNYQIPVCLYGKLTFASGSGLHEGFMVSDADKAEQFAEALAHYQTSLPARAADRSEA